MPESVRHGNDVVQQITDPIEALHMLATTGMRPFTKEDWLGFSGCETKYPMIGEDGNFILVLDGSVLNIIHCDDLYGGTIFQLRNI